MLLILLLTAGSVDVTTRREIVLHLAKNAISVVARTTSAICVSLSLSQSVTQGGQDRPMEINVLINVNVKYMRLASVKMTWMT